MNELITTNPILSTAILGWLDAKFHRSGSEKTRKAYQDTLEQFRNALAQLGIDLDSSNLTQIAFTAQAFSRFSARGQQVSSATINQRLAILSSFYRYAIKQNILATNPIDRVERSKVQAYAGASPLQTEQTASVLASINRTTLRGKRDYALLAILLSTGRRAAEVCNLTLGNVEWQHERAVLTFEHCKGGKVMKDSLTHATSAALAEWITAFYGGDRPANAPLWVVLKKAGRKDGEIRVGDPLGEQSIADVCKKHLKTSKVHSTRHTFAHEMEKAGAKISTIQSRLGHESIATTGRYLAALSSAENEYGETIAANIGIR